MKKTSSRIREEIAKLQDVLKAAETREAERIGRIALKAGLGEIEIEDSALLAAFEDLTNRFRTDPATRKHGSVDTRSRSSKPSEGAQPEAASISPGTAQGRTGEA
ncbi:conjugal transfer protein TraC [Rhizobium rhizophilum]|uniref:TraC family protein n=1 Tax=Rhizobium rhizophilum TaxID=1850373 RepID=A0ABY2QRZ9_9HYPH|nr:conjugal transfer protein TraC [Rhizobium rhizophilum]THV12796.1 TraC family protein [Rhizobium rhizophilum]